MPTDDATDEVAEPAAAEPEAVEPEKVSAKDALAQALRDKMAETGIDSAAGLFTHAAPAPSADDLPTGSAGGEGEDEGDVGAAAGTPSSASPDDADSDEQEADIGVVSSLADAYTDLNARAEQAYGRKLTASEADALFSAAGLAADIAALSTEQRLALQHIIYPAQSAPPGSQSQAPQEQPGVGIGGGGSGSRQGDSILPPLPDDADDYERAIYARVAEPVTQLEARLAQLEANTQQTIAAQQQAQLEQSSALADAAIAQWRDAHPDLTPEEHAALLTRTVQAGIAPSLIAQSNGDIGQGVAAALDMILYSTPELRDRMVQKQLADERARAQTDRTRQVKAASVGGGGGSAVSREQVAPENPIDRRAALAAGIARAMQE